MPLYWLVYRHNSQISVVIDLEHRSFMPVYNQRLMASMKASSPKAMSLIAKSVERHCQRSAQSTI